MGNIRRTMMGSIILILERKRNPDYKKAYVTLKTEVPNFF